jgi:DNA-binding NtrC family response regulator
MSVPSTMNSDPVLIVEDTSALQKVYSAILQDAGHQTIACETIARARQLFLQHKPGVVLLDLILPDGNGLSLLEEILAQQPDTKVIVFTANGTVNKAVGAMRAGAFDFILKPIEDQQLLNVVMNARSEKQPTAPLDEPLCGFTGNSDAMNRVYATIRSVSGSMATVFITGESGTGKEICAEAVHQHSNRAEKPFVPINCGAIPPGFLDSEVFGHVCGAFPGAMNDKMGAAAEADGGTLFLDEVCEMDLALQSRFLRFLQSSQIHPLGAAGPRKINTRIICATSRDPMEEIRAGRLRADLYYRLHVVPVHLPPLRDRGEDIIMIANCLLTQLSQRENRPLLHLTPETEALFRNHSWPGNVRELQNVLWNIVVLSAGPAVAPADLPREILTSLRRPSQMSALMDGANFGTSQAVERLIGRSLADIERRVIEQTIAREDGSVPAAARVLDVSPSTLYRKLEAWGHPARKRRNA